MTDSAKDLMPPEAEIRQILAQTMKENPSRYSVVVLQIEFARFMVRHIDKLRESLIESIRRLEDSFDNK